MNKKTFMLPAALFVLRAALFVLPAISLVLPALAQDRISSDEIIQKVNQGQSVEVSNAIIAGRLDLTEINTKAPENNGNSGKAYKSKVNVPLVFRNCTFQNDVIAYKVLEKDGKSKKLLNWGSDSQVLYTADFTEEAIFENCVFKGMTEFKYSDFAENVSFAGSDFSGEANFKYARFHAGADFSAATFPEEANFKYAHFGEKANFSSARLQDDATFKYADFKKTVDFQNTSFGGHADFKYTTFKQPTDFQQASFSEGSDFKYTSGDYRL